jgi:hypothetical protein
MIYFIIIILLLFLSKSIREQFINENILLIGLIVKKIFPFYYNSFLLFFAINFNCTCCYTTLAFQYEKNHDFFNAYNMMKKAIYSNGYFPDVIISIYYFGKYCEKGIGCKKSNDAYFYYDIAAKYGHYKSILKILNRRNQLLIYNI